MAEQEVLVTWRGEDGFPRAYAAGPLSNLEGVKEEARFHKDAYLCERAAFGVTEPETLTESVRVV